MPLFVRLQKDLDPKQKPGGIPGDWPAEVEAVPDGTPDPGDGRLVMKDEAELETYKLSQKGAYDQWYAGVTLPAVKESKFSEIDARTAALIAVGFGFGGKTFSLSIAAQNTFTGLYAIRDEPSLSYPVKVNTIDDLDTLSLKDSTEVANFYLSAVATYRMHLDSGTTLKDAVRAATTADEVNAITDPR